MLVYLSAQSLTLFQHAALVTHIPTATQTQSVPFWSPAGGGWGDPAIVAAVIGAVVAIIVALIGVRVTVYQVRQTRKIETEKSKIEREKNKIEQEKEEQQRLHDQEKEEQQRLYEQQREREKAEQQLRYEQEMERFRRNLDVEYREKEQEKEQERQQREATRQEMLSAQNNLARAVAYRKALHLDPYISRLQILDMQQPLEVANIYVRVRVHEDTIMRYAIDPTLVTAAEHRDPQNFFQARHHYLEQRVDTALDPDAAIRKYRQCVVVGDPGAGKTTLLKYLTLTLADSKHPDLSDLPIHVELNAFIYSKEEDILDYAARRWEERYKFPQKEALNYMDTMLTNGEAILLLDALDETVVGEQSTQADASYQKAWDAIMRLATRYPRAHIVVTARKAGYQQHRQLDGFTVVEVMDFRKEDIRQFIDNWFRCAQGVTRAGSADDLMARLDRNPRIQALAANPLLLSLIVLVYEAQLDLPDRRAELYHECVEVLLAKWDAKRNIRRRRNFKPDQKRQLLAEVAWHFHLQGQRYFREQELLTEIAQFLPSLNLSPAENTLILQEITSENGLLKEQARGWYGFLHLTIQEYFAALAINDQARFTMLVAQYADPWWEEVFLLYAGHVSDASPLLLNLLGQDPSSRRLDDLFHTNILMAGRCLTSSPTLRQHHLREDIIESLLTLFSQVPYTLLRVQIVEILGSLSGETLAFKLLELLNDEKIESSVSWRIADALGKMGERSVAGELVGLLKNEQIESYVYQKIIDTLGKIRERSVVGELVSLLKDTQIESYIRLVIALALVNIGDRSVVGELVSLLKDAQIEPHVRGYIVDALGKIGGRSVVGELVSLLKDEQFDSYVRGKIADALVNIGERSVVGELVSLLKDAQIATYVRDEIALALGQMGDRSVVGELVSLLKDTQVRPYVRGQIALALGQMGDRSVVGELVNLLKDAQVATYVRGQIALALGQMGDRSVVGELVSLLKDAQIEPHVRGQIALALGQMGDRSVVGELVSLLKDEQFEPHGRGQIALALGQMGDRSVVGELVSLLKDEQFEPHGRGQIALALGQMGDRSVVGELVNLLKDEQIEPHVRGQIALALGQMGERSVVGELVSLLKDEQIDPYVRGEIAAAVGKITEDEHTMTTCVLLLSQAPTDVANAIYRALWDMSRRAEVTIVVHDDGNGETVEFVPWQAGVRQ